MDFANRIMPWNRFRSRVVTGFWRHAALVGIATVVAIGSASPALAEANNRRQDAPATTQESMAADSETVSIVPEIPLRAWELHPYQVLVWVCHDGSPRVRAVEQELLSDVVRRSELTDPSGWLVYSQLAPARWRNRLIKYIDATDHLAGVESAPELRNADKLVVVSVRDVQGEFDIQVRELDVLTQQWGALVHRQTAQPSGLSGAVYGAITKAFMPIARVDRVDDQNHVFMRARAVNSCVRAVETETGEWVVEPIENSPVWVRPDDRFLPVIRRVDRNGNLDKLEPIDFTFLTIDRQEGFQIECSIHSYHRAPLSGRTSKRAQKLALVIRPPERSTVLTLVSKDDESRPLAGYEIWSRRPGQPREEESEFIGTTDWRGKVEIPPSPDGLRLIYVKRGSRALKKLPIIPGLYTELRTTIPDDEARLYAEGIINGFQTEILNLVAQRRVYEAQIEMAIERKDFEKADEILDKYQRLTSPQDLKNRMADEETRLKSLTSDKREVDSITSMFGSLREALSRYLSESREPQLREQLQKAKQAAAAASTS